ncbi:MAG: CPBP family glutamic-type intramembrane protease [Polyangiaceae bacterium]
MKETTRPKPSITPAAFKDSARVVGWTLGADAVQHVLAVVFARNAIGLYAIQAFAMELFAGKVGVDWSDASHGQASGRAIAKRVGIGALFATLAALLCFGAVAIHGGAIVKGRAGLAPLAIGLLSAGLIATRDELLLRGCVIRAFREVAPARALLVICGLVGAAGRFGDPTATYVEVAYNGALAVAFASAWLFDRGAWMALGAHAAWTFATMTLGRGAIFDVKPAAGGTFHDDLAVLAALSLVALASAAFSASRARGVNIEAGKTMNGGAHE